MSNGSWNDGQKRIAIQRCKTADAALVLNNEFERILEHSRSGRVSGSTASSLKRVGQHVSLSGPVLRAPRKEIA